MGGLAYLYRAVKSNVDIRREKEARKAAEAQAEAARQRTQAEIQKRAQAEQTAAIERNRNEALKSELKAEREQKAREEKINEQESSILVADGLDHLFDMPDSRLPISDTGSDTSPGDTKK